MKTIKLKPGKYSLLSCTYIALVDSSGTCCENCGRLISNMATISDESDNQYIVGLDCAKTILEKENYEVAKTEIAKSKKISEKIKMLEIYGKPYVLDPTQGGWPCYPPETRSGYMIKY